MMPAAEAWKILNEAECIFDAAALDAAVHRVADAVKAELAQSSPLVLSVMGGAVVFTGVLLPLLRFPLDFQTIHVTRYGSRTQGGEIEWLVPPRDDVRDRTVLVLDDILDEGHTMTAIRDTLVARGVKRFYSAVLADKAIGRPKPIQADFVGLTVPNRYVFGYGMDVRGAWRNLPEIYAMRD